MRVDIPEQIADFDPAATYSWQDENPVTHQLSREKEAKRQVALQCVVTAARTALKHLAPTAGYAMNLKAALDALDSLSMKDVCK